MLNIKRDAKGNIEKPAKMKRTKKDEKVALPMGVAEGMADVETLTKAVLGQFENRSAASVLLTMQGVLSSVMVTLCHNGLADYERCEKLLALMVEDTLQVVAEETGVSTSKTGGDEVAN